MGVSKEDLSGFYEWTREDEKSVFNGNPSRRPFDRLNGNQVLFIINLLLSGFENPSAEDGRKIERLITTKLPIDRSSEMTVFNWLHEEVVKK